MEIVDLFLALVILDAAAVLWGVDSREKVDSSEWQRRRLWRGFGGGVR